MPRVGPFHFPRVSPRFHCCDSCELASAEMHKAVRLGQSARGRPGDGDLDVCLECLRRVTKREC